MTLAGLPPAGTAALGPHRSSIAQPASTPVQRFGPALAGRAAWLGATVGRYSFGVGLFHTQLQAGFIPAHRLSRRTNGTAGPDRAGGAPRSPWRLAPRVLPGGLSRVTEQRLTPDLGTLDGCAHLMREAEA